MSNDIQTGFAKLFHPRGPLVTLPVPSDPKEAFNHISKCLDVGWLVVAPGLEEGEQRDEVGYIVRGSHESHGECTPTLLLYSTNEGLSFPFLKVYLNNDKDVQAFEYASGMRLAEFQEYAGSDKPERGKSSKTDAYIIRIKKPFGVVFKNNPKYKESDREAAEKAKQVYKVPRRLFVRWAGQVNGEAPKPFEAPSTNQTTKPEKDKPLTPAEAHTKILAQFRVADTVARLDGWAKFGKENFDFAPAQEEEQSEAYHDALERINRANGLRKPVGTTPAPRPPSVFYR